MLTAANYITQSRNVDFSTLPAKFRNIHETLLEGAEGGPKWELFLSDSEVRGMVDGYLVAVNNALAAQTPAPAPAKRQANPARLASARRASGIVAAVGVKSAGRRASAGKVGAARTTARRAAQPQEAPPARTANQPKLASGRRASSIVGAVGVKSTSRRASAGKAGATRTTARHAAQAVSAVASTSAAGKTADMVLLITPAPATKPKTATAKPAAKKARMATTKPAKQSTATDPEKALESAPVAKEKSVKAKKTAGTKKTATVVKAKPAKKAATAKSKPATPAAAKKTNDSTVKAATSTTKKAGSTAKKASTANDSTGKPKLTKAQKKAVMQEGIDTAKQEAKRTMSAAQVIAIGRQINAKRYKMEIDGQVYDVREDFDTPVTNKRRLAPTRENLIKWAEQPGRFDLIGVDAAGLVDVTVFKKRDKDLVPKSMTRKPRIIKMGAALNKKKRKPLSA